MSETSLLPAYLIVGTDGVKRDHAVSRMKARLEKSGMVEFNLDERDMTKDPDIESIIGSLKMCIRDRSAAWVVFRWGLPARS